MTTLSVAGGFVQIIHRAAPFPPGGKPPGRLAAWAEARAPRPGRPLLAAPDAGYPCSFRNQRRIVPVISLELHRFAGLPNLPGALFLVGCLGGCIITLKSYLGQARDALDLGQFGSHASDLFFQFTNRLRQDGSIYRGLRVHGWLQCAACGALAARLQTIAGMICKCLSINERESRNAEFSRPAAGRVPPRQSDSMGHRSRRKERYKTLNRCCKRAGASINCRAGRIPRTGEKAMKAVKSSSHLSTGESARGPPA